MKNYKAKLFIISFIEGATVMATEITSAKLLAPFFGSSLYVWSSILAITLGGLASGYFIGGLLSQKENKKQILLYVLILACCLLALIPSLSNTIYIIANNFSLLPAVVLSALFIVFPTMLFLGTTSPLIISLLSNNESDSGFNSGRVYAISTVGGIISTFLCGFYLIPTIGISNSLIGFSILLATVSLFLIEKKNIKLISFYLIALVIMFYSNLKHTTKNSLFLIDGILGKIEVKDEKQNDFTTYRKLLVNNIVQSEMNLKTSKTTSAYIQNLEKILPHFKKGNALVLGLGGGLASNMLAENGYKVTAVEFDSRIIDIANTYFYLNKSVNSICSDARLYLNDCKQHFDLIFFDISKAEEQPSYIFSIESITKIKTLLKDSAIVLINTHGYIENEIGLGTQCLLSTLKKSGFYLKVCGTDKDENYRNLILIATNKPFTDTLINEISFTLTNPNIINTDDKPILEKLNAKANQAWRLNYLKNYILKN